MMFRSLRGGRPSRVLMVGVTAAIAAATLTACGSGGGGGGGGGSTSANGPEKSNLTVTFGTNSPSTTPLWVAIDEGIFAKNGLSVKAVQATSNVGATAVVSGAADIYYGEATTSFQAVAQGTPLNIVGNLRTLNDFKFYTQPSITSASQLTGKTIAISAAGDSTELSTRIAFGELHASLNGTTLLPTGTSSNRLASLIAGRVAGTLLTEPTATAAKKAGMRLLLDQTKEPFVGSAVTVSKTFQQNDPKTIVAFLKSMAEAVKYIQDPANKTKVIGVIAKYTEAKTTDDATVNGYATYSAKGALTMDPMPSTAAGDAMLEGLKSEDPKRFDSLTLAKVYNTTFAKQLETSGFLKQLWGSELTSS